MITELEPTVEVARKPASKWRNRYRGNYDMDWPNGAKVRNGEWLGGGLFPSHELAEQAGRELEDWWRTAPFLYAAYRLDPPIIVEHLGPVEVSE